MKLWLALLFLFLATPAQAATYWVHPTGNNGACTNTTTPQGSGGNAKTTIAAGIACMTSGDTLNIRAGTYTERILPPVSLSSSSYPTATIIQGYASEMPTLNRTDASITATCVALSTPTTGQTYAYFIFRNFKCDGGAGISKLAIGAGGGGGGGAVHHIKFEGLELTRYVSPFFLGGDDQAGTDLWATNNYVHDNGDGAFGGHCFYAETPRVLIENNRCINQSGFGIQIYNENPLSPDDGVIRNNWWENTGIGDGRAGFAIALIRGTGHQVYNNVIINGQGGMDIKTSGHMIYSNTFYGNGIGHSGACCYPTINADATTGTTIRNNIVIGNAVNSISIGGSGTTQSGNLTSGIATDIFTNPSSKDFTLKVGSAAIGAGIPLSSCPGFGWCTSYSGPSATGVATTGLARPIGGTWDAGAYEYGVPAVVSQQLVLALPLDEGVGGIAVDVSGQKNNASLNGGATWDNVGKYGKAVMFDGAGYLNIPAASSLALAPAMTLEAWVYPTGTLTTFSTLIFQDRYYLYASSDPGYCPTPAGAPGGGYSAAAAENYLCATATPTPNDWSHLAITQDGVNLTVYLNGAPVSSKTSTDPMVPATANVTIGASAYGENFTGKIDEVRVYNYARNPGQIVSDMNTPLIGAPGKLVDISAPASVEISAAASLEISAD